jgi:hypothetical protein
VRASVFLLCALLSCTRQAVREQPSTTRSLAALREAIQRGDPTPATDVLSLAQAEFLQRMSLLHDVQQGHVGDTPAGVSEAGWRRMLSELATVSTAPRLMREFGPALDVLGNGHCTQVAPAALPDTLASIAPERPTWPAFAAPEVRTPLELHVRGSVAGDFRCEGSTKVFRAIFIPRTDGTLAVARIVL